MTAGLTAELTEAPPTTRSYSSLILGLLLASMVLFWSFNYVVAKIALRQFPPLLLVALRTALAGLLMLPTYWFSARTGPSPWTWRELRLLLPLGLLGVVGNQFFFVLGLGRTSVGHAAILIGLTPLIVLILAWLGRQESLTVRKVVGMGIAVVGILILQLGRTPGGNPANPLGDLYVFLGAVSFAAFTVLGKQIGRRHGGMVVSLVAYVGGGLLLSPLMFWQGRGFPFASVTWVGWACVLYMAAFSSVISYLIYYHALKRIAASRVAGLSYLQPVLATLMAIPVLREPISSGLLLGGSLALVGVWVTESAPART